MGCTIEIFAEKVRPVLHQHFKQRRNWWYDDALSTAYERAVSFSEKQSLRAKSLKNNDNDISRGSATTLLPSKKIQQHRKADSVVEKKRPTRRWQSHFKADDDV